MLKQKIIFTCSLGFIFSHLITSAAFAATEVVNVAPQASIQITLANQQDSSIRLEAKQAPLSDILTKIAQTTHIPIHYALLPEEPVTVTCSAEAVSTLLECLLGSRVDRVYRYPQHPTLNNANSLNAAAQTAAVQPEEVWLLATNTPVKPGIREHISALAKMPEAATEEQVQLDAILKQASSKNAEERLGALSNLGGTGQKDDPNIRKTLQSALTDKNANVRMQALTSLVQREGENATFEVQQALNDKDINVRLAVVGITHDTEILQQALSDSDKAIRDLATSKLNYLAARKNR